MPIKNEKIQVISQFLTFSLPKLIPFIKFVFKSLKFKNLKILLKIPMKTNIKIDKAIQMNEMQ